MLDGDAGTPACDTVTPFCLNEKMSNPDGVRVPSCGVMRTQPLWTVDAVPAVRTTVELRGGML